MDPPTTSRPANRLRARRAGIDSDRQAVLFLRADSPVCRSEGFDARARVRVANGEHSIIAVLNVVTSGLLEPDEAGLSDAAWRALGVADGEIVTLTHAPTLESFGHVRAKLHGIPFDRTSLDAIVRDVVAGTYSDVHLASFITACAGDGLSQSEVIALTRAMLHVGERLDWERPMVVDKHCVGGLPGNRTTLLVVPIVTALGLVMPKTSSRAITSPAGTADTMETLAPVELDLPVLRRVVEKEGGCIAWGGAVKLSPADDLLIRVERAIDLDSEGQLVASVVSKKAAAGSTHVVIDIPVGPTAKVRGPEAARDLGRLLQVAGSSVGLVVEPVLTDGTQPVGRGIGPALEARDVLAVLRGEEQAPRDLAERAVLLAGRVLELAEAVPPGEGAARATEVLADGRAWSKFQAICEAQGGLREPPRAPHRHAVTAPRDGQVAVVDNRRLARVAKLAGAPRDRAAGLEIHVQVGDAVEQGAPVFTVHAESPGELEYALAYVRAGAGVSSIVTLGDAP